MELMFCDFWWVQLWKFVKEFVSSCDVYVHANNCCHFPHGLFQPLPVFASPSSLISMDFIMDLPQSSSFDSILVVVNCFTKMVHFIPCDKSIINDKTTNLFLNHVFHYHGFLTYIFLIVDFSLHPSFGSDSSSYYV
jgi:hypothetical protein